MKKEGEIHSEVCKQIQRKNRDMVRNTVTYIIVIRKVKNKKKGMKHK